MLKRRHVASPTCILKSLGVEAPRHGKHRLQTISSSISGFIKQLDLLWLQVGHFEDFQLEVRLRSRLVVFIPSVQVLYLMVGYGVASLELEAVHLATTLATT